MLKRTILGLSLALIVGFTASAQPEVEFSGFLDADVWTDFEGSFFTNHELDLGMGIGFTENVAAHVYVTMTAGSVPAGGGRAAERWGAVAFDGVDIEIGTDFGTFTVGDLVYQYGGFNYYLYKRLSMITTESFTRGIQYSLGNDMISQTLLVGAADVADEIVDIKSSYVIQGDTAGDSLTVLEEITSDSAMANVLDIGGATALSFSEAMSVGVFYGTRVDIYNGFEETGMIYAGAEFLGTFGEALALKADIGLLNLPKPEVNDDGEMVYERSMVTSFLIEPALTLDKFSTAASFFTLLDPDTLGGAAYYGLGDEMFVYVEPGYAFTDMLALGLPIEYHAFMLDNEDDDEFWLVPTFYVLPADGVQWWIWGQYAHKLDDKLDPGFGLGSELIVEF